MKTRTLLLLAISIGTLGLLHGEGFEPRQADLAAAAKPEANLKQVVRIYAVKAILGPVPREGDESGKKVRAESWDSLMSLFDTALIMAGCEQPRPTFGLHNQTNCLAVGGTAEQIDLISQAVLACLENEQPRAPAEMPVRVVK